METELNLPVDVNHHNIELGNMTVEEVQKVCPFLGGLATEKAEFLMKLSSMGNEFEKEEFQTEPHDKVETIENENEEIRKNNFIVKTSDEIITSNNSVQENNILVENIRAEQSSEKDIKTTNNLDLKQERQEQIENLQTEEVIKNEILELTEITVDLIEKEILDKQDDSEPVQLVINQETDNVVTTNKPPKKEKIKNPIIKKDKFEEVLSEIFKPKPKEKLTEATDFIAPVQSVELPMESNEVKLEEELINNIENEVEELEKTTSEIKVKQFAYELQGILNKESEIQTEIEIEPILIEMNDLNEADKSKIEITLEQIDESISSILSREYILDPEIYETEVVTEEIIEKIIPKIEEVCKILKIELSTEQVKYFAETIIKSRLKNVDFKQVNETIDIKDKGTHEIKTDISEYLSHLKRATVNKAHLLPLIGHYATNFNQIAA